MGNKVENHGVIREHGRWGFVLGRKGRLKPDGSIETTCSAAPDGMPWTFHEASPMVTPGEWAAVCGWAQEAVSADDWTAYLVCALPALGEWLQGRLSRQREALWGEARMVAD